MSLCTPITYPGLPAGSPASCVEQYEYEQEWDAYAFDHFCGACGENNTPCQRKARDEAIRRALLTVNRAFDCVGDSSEMQTWLANAIAAIQAQS